MEYDFYPYVFVLFLVLMISIYRIIVGQNPYNLTGVCNRISCKIANSRYPTNHDHEGSTYNYCFFLRFEFFPGSEESYMPFRLKHCLRLSGQESTSMGKLSELCRLSSPDKS